PMYRCASQAKCMNERFSHVFLSENEDQAVHQLPVPFFGALMRF
ncbi:unnamed protein product, partial [Mycena citricolor]